MTTDDMKWIERRELPNPVSVEGPEFIEIEVPVGAEFMGVQHYCFSTMLVMLVRDRFGANIVHVDKGTEFRTVVRVRDGRMVDEKKSRYIGSDGWWHIFEVLEK